MVRIDRTRLSRRHRDHGHALCTKPLPCLAAACPSFDGWVMNAADEAAIDRGDWFDPVMGGYAVWWIERYCRLYEDRWAGEPAVQHGCKTCLRSWYIPQAFDAEMAIERSESHLECLAAGHDMCWQYSFIMRLFGWLKWSNEFSKPVRRFNRADVWIPKKNMKSPELAFLGWHLLVGDGVMGQHVYFGAKDGSQAKEIVGSHAVAAWEQSPEIRETTTYNINEMLFKHKPSRSTMKPLSSSNQRTTQSKEGINGSVLIDEVHVVDAAFMKRIKRAGISREEPLLVGVSTAGLDTLSYGKERQDYGREVESGAKPDLDYLYICYEAEQTTDLETISEEKAVELGRKHNPAWGITVRESEYRADFQESRASTQDTLADFGTYRLNIWQTTVSPWFYGDSWNRCADDFDLTDLSGMSCDLGLDMSRTRDMTAAALVFDLHEGRRFVWPMFWLPENTAAKHAALIPKFEHWVRAGKISTTPQDTISQAQVFDELSQVLSKVNCRRVFYDPTFADWITEQLEAVHKIERIVFTQNLKSFAPVTEAMEAEILDGVLCHPRHDVLDWQIGHCNVYRHLSSRQKRPVRPDEKNRKDPRTIDGVIAMAMGYFGSLEEKKPSVYEERGILVF